MKQELRSQFISIRQQLSRERRREASQKLVENILSFASAFERVASFSSFQTEIDLWPLNQILAQQQRLLLPRREKNLLCFHSIEELPSREPIILFEPDPTRWASTPVTMSDLLLVPALAFDAEHFRLGYGKGYYDRFLCEHLGVVSAGVGFLEQMSSDLLPREPWDQPVVRLFLF